MQMEEVGSVVMGCSVLQSVGLQNCALTTRGLLALLQAFIKHRSLSALNLAAVNSTSSLLFASD
eukprot:m.192841 g.192841  ORF g.192841 m.192841 type:complete len:64 (-) comp53669_c1_seq5:694-885(-)